MKSKRNQATESAPSCDAGAFDPAGRTYWQVMDALVVDHRVSYGAKNFWHFLRSKADNDTGKCWWGREKIAEALDCSNGSIENWTSELRGSDWLDFDDKFSRKFRKPKDPDKKRRITRRTYIVLDGFHNPFFGRSSIRAKAQQKDFRPKNRAENFRPKKSRSSARKLGRIRPKNRAVSEESNNEDRLHSVPSSSPTAVKAFAPLTPPAAYAAGTPSPPGSPEEINKEARNMILAVRIDDPKTMNACMNSEAVNRIQHPSFPGEIDDRGQQQFLSPWGALMRIQRLPQADREAALSGWKAHMLQYIGAAESPDQQEGQKP